MVKSLDFILQLVGNHWIILSKAFLLLEPAKLISGESSLFTLTHSLCH